jgi:hypothetical protein
MKALWALVGDEKKATQGTQNTTTTPTTLTTSQQCPNHQLHKKHTLVVIGDVDDDDVCWSF